MLVKARPRDAADLPPADAAPPPPQPGESDVIARRQSMRDLAASGDGAIAGLCARLGTELEPSVREIILVSLIAMKSEAAVAGLLPYLGSEDPGLRNAVIEALHEMPDEVEPHIESLLADPDSDVRIFAVNILGALPHAKVPYWLTQVVKNDQHVNVCAAAVDCLAGVGDEAAIAPLEALPARFPGVPFIAFAVAVAVRNIVGQ
jgi:HEAT repeat protein